ncbi:unnamed protein product [Amoebophrya sp. A25]|nr:unnamed protein product [Amoebophrya sp. A25]|eukprot:GSA25T00018112001.1
MEDRDKALLDGDKDKALLDAGDKDKKASGGDKDKKASGGDQPDGEGTEEAKCSTTSGSSTSSSSSSSKNGDQIPRIPQADPGDLATKECTQETAVTFIGLLLGMLLAKLCGSESSSGQQGSAGGEETTFWNSFSLSWGLFLFLTAVHVWANYRAVRCLNLRFLNRTRTYLLVQSFLKEQQIKDHGNTSSGGQSLSVRSINRRETLYQWFRVNCYRRRPKIAEISCAEAQRAYLRSLRDCTEQRRLLQKDEHEKNFLDSVGINKADTTVLPAEMLLSSEILEKHQLASKDKESSRRTLVTDKDGRYAVGRIEGAWTAFLKQNCNDMDKLESYFEVCKKTLLLQNDKVAEEASFEKFLGSLRTQGWDLDPRSFRLQPGKWRLKLNA